MLLKISLIIFFLFYHLKLIGLEDADAIFNLLDSKSSNISFIDNGILPKDFISNENNDSYFYNSKRFGIKEILYLDNSNITYKRLFNNLYYVEIIIENKSKYIPLIFSESYNRNWEILEIEENLFNDSYFYNLFINFLELTKLKISFLNSEYSLVDNKKYLANNYSNFFLINKNENDLNKKYIIYYEKTYVYQLILLIFILCFPLLIFISIFIKKYE